MLLAFDIGTTGNKAALVDPRTGSVVGSALSAYPTRYTPDGGAQQEPQDWWRSVSETCRTLRERYPQAFSRVQGIGVSGMMNGVVLIDGYGHALRPAILHADVRSVPQCRVWERAQGREAIFQATANRADPHLTLPKMLWLQEHEPDILRRAAYVVQAKDYIVGCLTGTWGITDPSDASLTGAFDVGGRTWARDVWHGAGLPLSLLPGVVPSAQVVGSVTDDAAQWTGLPTGIPVVMGGGDGACATAGAGVGVGEAYCYLGGTSWIGLRAPVPLYDLRLSNYCALDDAVTVFGTVQCAGSSVEWLAGLLGHASHADLDILASAVPPGARNLFFLPYLQGERAPLWDADARGVFFGLATHHGRAEVGRATLEGVGFALRSILDVFADNGHALPSLRVLGGGAKSALWRRVLAGIFGRELQTVADVSAATSCGAAMAAGIGVGLYASWNDAYAQVGIAHAEAPDSTLVAAYAPRAAFFQSLYPALQERFAALQELGD